MRPLLLLLAFIALVAIAGSSCLTQPGRPEPGPGPLPDAGSGSGSGDAKIPDVPLG